MPRYFTKTGLEAKKKQIQEKEDLIRALQKEAGTEAEVGGGWHDNFGWETPLVATS